MLVAGMLFSAVVHAEDKDFPMSVNSATSGETVTAAPASGIVSRSAKDIVTVRLNNSCFPTNLRGVTNPLAASAIITAKFTLVLGGTDYAFTVNYPSDLVLKTGMTTATPMPMASDRYSISGSTGSAALFGNSVLLKTKVPTSVTVDPTGQVIIPAKGDVSLKSSSFVQTVNCEEGPAVYGPYGYSSYKPTRKCGDYMGKNGAVTASFGGISVSADKSVVDINVSFPGETGFCGGYWSPLMVFFDDARPRFDNSSSFPLNPVGKTMWPEAESPGWFVALDRNKSGLIDQKDELFGDNASEVNGFEVLRKLDSNQDDLIDHRDREFKRLVIWNDKNGDGVSQKEEMVKLHKKVVKISLKYEKGIVTPIGAFAEARERADFWFKDGKKVKKGKIVDIWLAPEEQRLSQL